MSRDIWVSFEKCMLRGRRRWSYGKLFLASIASKSSRGMFRNASFPEHIPLLLRQAVRHILRDQPTWCMRLQDFPYISFRPMPGRTFTGALVITLDYFVPRCTCLLSISSYAILGKWPKCELPSSSLLLKILKQKDND